MVLAERNSELVRNGRRSRGPSPNGHGTSSAGGGSSTGVGGGGVGGAGTPENSSDDDNSIKRNGKSKTKQSEYEEKIRVGRDYQAVCPPLVPEVERKPEVLNERALLVWSPTKEIPDTKLDDYISVAKEKYGYNGEQALGMLFWHKHDLERAVLDLANFTPFPDEWTTEDRVLFEQAFQFHGKSFHRIRQMLPDKSIASLVKYYYSWKKTRHRHSVMDRQEKAKANKEGSENGSDNGSNEDSDNDDKVQLNKQAISALKKQEEDEEDIRPPEITHRISPRWSNEELSLAIQGIRKYGKDFQTIAELIGTKTEAHVRTFFHSSRRRYNLDQEVKKFEAEREAAHVASKAAEAAASTAAASTEVKASESAAGTTTNTSATKKKESSVEKDGTSVVEESDTTTSSSEALTGATKSLNDEGKGPSSGSNASSTAQDNEIMEIDLEAEPADPAPIMEPPAKKLALAVPNKELPEPTAV